MDVILFIDTTQETWTIGSKQTAQELYYMMADSRNCLNPGAFAIVFPDLIKTG